MTFEETFKNWTLEQKVEWALGPYICNLSENMRSIIVDLKAENERLKRELKQTEAQDQVVINGLRKENRKTLHALWMARTERAFAERRRYCAMAAFNNIENDALRIKWFEIQWKCREKAKEFE